MINEFENYDWKTLTKSRSNANVENNISIFKNGILNFSEDTIAELNIDEYSAALIQWCTGEDNDQNEGIVIKIKFTNKSGQNEKFPLFTFCKTKSGNRFFNIKKLLKNIGIFPNAAIRLKERESKEELDFSSNPYFVHNKDQDEIFVVLPEGMIGQAE